MKTKVVIDTPFVALSILLNAKLLTGDKKLSKHLVNNDFTNVASINELI
jgi:predicted nucleic acid-binding protein